MNQLLQYSKQAFNQSITTIEQASIQSINNYNRASKHSITTIEQANIQSINKYINQSINKL